MTPRSLSRARPALSAAGAALGLLATLACLSLPVPVRAETVNCSNITSLPATLTTQGVYCLKQDLATSLASGDAITFAANNITLDCNGYKIGGLAAGPATEATALRAGGRMNLVVRNCNIRGFRSGISFSSGGGGHLIEDNRLDGITYEGIFVTGDGNRIRDNAIYDTGGSSYGFSIAIQAVLDAEVTGNSIHGVQGTAGPAVGIAISQSNAGLVADNRVRGVVGSTQSYGILFSGSTDPVVRGNHVAGPGTVGIDCGNNGAHALGNQVIGFTTALSGCLNGGGNYLQP